MCRQVPNYILLLGQFPRSILPQNMKFKLLALQILFLLIAAPSWAQIMKGPDGFLDMPWGTPVEDVKKKLLTREGVTFTRNVTDGFLLSGGTFAGHPVSTWALYFDRDRLCRAEARLSGGGNRAEVLQTIKKELMNRYGAPARSHGNGNCRWKFPQSATHPLAEAVELSVDSGWNEVFVSYICESPIPSK